MEDLRRIRDNLSIIRGEIALAAERAGRDKDSIRLLAVTKTFSADIVDLALDSGIDLIGENKVQEAEVKLPLLKAGNPEFHFIGHLQANKVRRMLALRPTLIHSVDSAEIATRIDRIAGETGFSQPILIEVNTSGEASKFGVTPGDLPELVETVVSAPHISLRGLMTIGALSDREDEVRRCFELLKHLSVHCLESRGINHPELSMGMSHDFRLAIAEGATIIRIGSAIFGQRTGY